MCRAVAGSVCRWGTRRGACPAGRWLTVPFRNPQGGACLLGYPPPLTLVCFFAPIPPTPFPSGEGGAQGYFMQGAPPLASPGAEPTGCRKTDRTAFLLAVPAAKERGDRGRGTSAFEMVLSPGAGRASAAGGLPFLSPVCPAFSLLFCPIPPTPFPSGEGGDYKFILPGAEPGRHGKGANHAPSGGLFPVLPARPDGRAPAGGTADIEKSKKIRK